MKIVADSKVPFLKDVFEPYAEYEIAVEFALLSKKEERVAQAFDVLLRAEGDNGVKAELFNRLKKVESVEEYINAVDSTPLSLGVRGLLKEFI